MTIQPFWIQDPTILLNKDYIFELWPTANMCFEEKLNAITRLILLMTVLGFLATTSLRILLVGIITIAIIVFLYKNKKPLSVNVTENFKNKENENENENKKKDSFANADQRIINPDTLESFLKSEFKMGNKKNPFSNVLLTQISDEPERKQAPPSFNPDVDENITRDTKKMIQYLNPEIKNTNKQLFSSLTDNFDLDQSNRIWYSMPNTQVVNNQGAFAEYLYDNLKYSGKESTAEGAITRVADSYRYTLY